MTDKMPTLGAFGVQAMTDKMPALPEPIGEIVGTRGEEGTSEFFGYFADDYVTDEKQRVFTADQMLAYAAVAVAQFKEDAGRWKWARERECEIRKYSLVPEHSSKKLDADVDAARKAKP